VLSARRSAAACCLDSAPRVINIMWFISQIISRIHLKGAQFAQNSPTWLIFLTTISVVLFFLIGFETALSFSPILGIIFYCLMLPVIPFFFGSCSAMFEKFDARAEQKKTTQKIQKLIERK
jgi:hypothetical protein